MAKTICSRLIISSSFLSVLSALPSPVFRFSSWHLAPYDALHIKKKSEEKKMEKTWWKVTHINILYQHRVFLCIFFFFFFHIGYYYYYYYYYYHIITITINTTTITITLPLLLLLINCYYVVYRVVKFSGSQRSTRDEAEDEDKAMCPPPAISTCHRTLYVAFLRFLSRVEIINLIINLIINPRIFLGIFRILSRVKNTFPFRLIDVTLSWKNDKDETNKNIIKMFRCKIIKSDEF